MKRLSYYHNKRYCLPAIFLLLFAFAISPVFGGTLKVKTGGEGTEVATESIRPHDYTLVAKNIPCVYHFFSDNMERMKFTADQKKILKAIDNSPEERALYSRAEKIQALEFDLRKAIYSNHIKLEEVETKLLEIAKLRLEQTLGFIEMQGRLLNMLSPDQYSELKSIITEKGLF